MSTQGLPVERVRVCVVCAGNICRSPMAEAVLRTKLDRAGLGDRVVVDSAGTGGWHVGQGAHARSTAALQRRGYALTHAARQFEAGWFGERDLVLALDSTNLADLTALAPADLPAGRLRLLSASGDVPDPYGRGEPAYEHALDLIEQACDNVVEELRRTLDGPVPDRSDD